MSRIRRVHEGITGVTPDGQPYRANDPDLLTWVHDSYDPPAETRRREAVMNRIVGRIAANVVNSYDWKYPNGGTQDFSRKCMVISRIQKPGQ